VYLVKRKTDGTIEKYKARKVSRGFTQEEGINYDETYAQMMRTETLKILLVIALHREWAIRQWDVVAAYLQALLKYDIYITDINEEGETESWKLHKALYGLKQAGHEWFIMLCDIMGTFGMYQCTSDEGTYVSTANQTIIGIHVNDLIGITPTEAHLDRAERSVEGQVELDTRGKLSKMLGIELTWGKGQVILTQTSLIESMTRQFLTTPVGKRSSLPLDPHSYASDEIYEEVAKYQSIVGGLLFIARMTRPEISIHVNLLGRHTKKHTLKHYATALRVLEYLYSTKTEGIVLRKVEGEELEVNIYADASYGGEGSRSQMGVMITLGNQLIGWYSRRQEHQERILGALTPCSGALTPALW